MLRSARISSLAVIASALVVSSAQAELIGVELLDFPDIASGLIDVTYDAGTNEFIADGFALKYDDDGSDPNIDILNGSFVLLADIDENGDALGGSLSIGGTISPAGPTLLTADLVDFGFQDGGGMLLDFLFTITGGDLADDFGGVGGVLGVIMDIDADGYSGNWTESFDNLINGIPGTGAGVADTGIPAPSALALLGLAALMGGRRRRDSSFSRHL